MEQVVHDAIFARGLGLPPFPPCDPHSGPASSADNTDKWMASNPGSVTRTYPLQPQKIIDHSKKVAKKGIAKVFPTTRNNTASKNLKGKLSDGEDEEDETDSLKCGEGAMRCDEINQSDSPHKQTQMTDTLKWLTDNYERSEGVCLPRCVLYTHYLDFCKKNRFTPAGAATFGKIIRQRFPKLTTRRLGTRGQSKYHYYGIGIKETSIYYHSVYTGKGLTRFSGTKVKTEGSNRKYSLSSKTGTLLPEFPDPSNLILTENLDSDKVETFTVMYRTHCQRILDTITSANFEEVQNFLLHFWQGMPDHLLPLLQSQMITQLVAYCDSILYKVLIDVLVPSSIQDMPDSLCTEIRAFIRHLPDWLESSLEDVPEQIKQHKLKVLKHFIKDIQRQISFVHLAQTSRGVLLSGESITEIGDDLKRLDFVELAIEAGCVDPHIMTTHGKTAQQYFEDLKCLISKQSSIECFTEWADNLIDTSVLKACKGENNPTSKTAADFLLRWTLFSSLLMRHLTLRNATSFGSVHLLHMMLTEYVFLVLETQQTIHRERQTHKEMSIYLRTVGDMTVKAKMRLSANKPLLSPKAKRKKMDDVNTGEVHKDVAGENAGKVDSESKPGTTHTMPTAFVKPTPQVPPINRTTYFQDDHNRFLGNHHPGIPLSPMKHFSSFAGNTFEKNVPYLQHISIATFPELLNGTGNNLPSPRVSSGVDSISQGFSPTSYPGSGFSVPNPAPYWNESRSMPTISGDSYSAYQTYNKYQAPYECQYDRAGGSMLRAGSYQDNLGSCSSAFNPTSRGLYGRTNENVPASFQIGNYGNGYMDMSTQSSNFMRQDLNGYHPHNREEFYTQGLSPSFTQINKTYVTPFR